jgi:hypothetical protein
MARLYWDSLIQYIMIVHGNSTIQNSDFQSRAPRKMHQINYQECPELDTMQKSIENRYNSFKILTKMFETFCPLHERPRHFEKDQAAH